VNWAQHILVFGLRAYQRVLSPMLTRLVGPLGHCRYTPTCSQYAIEAVQTHGAIKGALLAAWRILRCGPWGRCGHDPVPPRKSKNQKFSVSPFNDALFPSGREIGKGHARR
jgi:hypothetical protein